MAGSFSISDLDDGLIARLKRRAARHGRSTEAEIGEILREVVAREVETGFDELAAELRALTAVRNHTPAEVLLRQVRDER